MVSKSVLANNTLPIIFIYLYERPDVRKLFRILCFSRACCTKWQVEVK